MRSVLAPDSPFLGRSPRAAGTGLPPPAMKYSFVAHPAGLNTFSGCEGLALAKMLQVAVEEGPHPVADGERPPPQPQGHVSCGGSD